MNKLKFLLFFLVILIGNISVIAQPKRFGLNNHQNDLETTYFKNLSRLISSNLDTQQLAQTLADAYLKKRVISAFPDTLTMQQAQEIQNNLVQRLTPYQGSMIGYKAGLTNPKAQEKFNVSQPILGIFLERMLLPSGTKVPIKFAAIPMLEGDLMVRVKDEKINQATNPAATLNHLDAVIPFLELPDLVYDKEVKLNGAMLTAINVGARLGIVGTPILLSQSDEKIIELNKIEMIIVDESGEILAKGNSNTLLGNPLNVVFWIKEQLNSQGKMLKRGDLLSLGSMTPLIPVTDAKTVYVKYQGLGGNNPVEISVTFEE